MIRASRWLCLGLALLLVAACGNDRRKGPSKPSKAAGSEGAPYDYSPNKRQPDPPAEPNTKKRWVISDDTFLCKRIRDMHLYEEGETDSGTAYARMDKGHLMRLDAGVEVDQDLDKPEKESPAGITWIKVDIVTGDAKGHRGNVDKTKLRPK